MTTAFAKKATSNIEQLERWAVDYVGCAWALATGQESGVFVVEMNGELGRNAFQKLEWNKWNWEQTLQSVAGNRGYAYFRWPVGLAFRITRKEIAPGLTVRGEGDFILIPPSLISGVSHAWRSPDVHVADAPTWLLDSIFAVSAGKVSGEKFLCFRLLINAETPEEEKLARGRKPNRSASLSAESTRVRLHASDSLRIRYAEAEP